MDSISEIKSKVSSFRNDSTFIATRKRWDSDFDLWRLKSYDPGKGYYAYTSNSPRNLANKAIGMLTEAELLIRVPEEILKKEERETANNVERFLYGALNWNDEHLMRIPDQSSIRNQKAWYSVVRGGYGERIYVYKDEKGETITDIAIWDLYNTSYWAGKNGIKLAVYQSKITKDQAKDEYNVGKGGSELVDRFECWSDEEHGVIVGNEWGTEPVKHRVGYCPVYILRVGAIPPVWQDLYENTGKHIGESIFAANRDIYPQFNKTISDLVTLVRRGVKVPLGVWSPSGDFNLEEDIWQVEKAASVPLRSDVVIKPLIEPSMPADAGNLINIMSGEVQRGGLSHVAEGELGFRLSGFAINQLQSSISTVIVPFAQTMERGYTIACISLLEQFAQGGFKAVEVRGRTSRNQPFGIPAAIKIKPSDIRGNWHPEIALEPVLPKDDAQRYILAQQATQGDRPLMSRRTAQESLLMLSDPDMENERIDEEFGSSLPMVRLLKSFMAAVADGNETLARTILGELERMTGGAQGAGGGGGGGGGLSRLEAASAGAPGAGMPFGETGVPSNVLPSEQLGGIPGGAMNAQPPLPGLEV